ncbi:GNAT family N-acetyltransferase [Metabacillus fastidiosus]|uniref:GNAT family N-acetyltransferase n=1 Tax=Metabacillus fastidiosus TaxID=1458 RepID=UPI002E24EE35|nr:GNAT family N-acetyltransferase [Metabacillus fastidiosus]
MQTREMEEKMVCELQKLYIAPEVQGIGLLKKLMKVALNFAKENFYIKMKD